MARMVQVQIEVENGASRFCVSVRAATVGRALRLAGASYPDASVRVAFPTKPGPSLVSRIEGEGETAGVETAGSAA